MTREEYIKMRKAGHVTYDLLFEYYINHAKVPVVNNVHDFKKLWDIQSQMYQMSGDVDIQKRNVKYVTDYYDNKFNILTLFDKGGILIDVYANDTNKGSLNK